MKLAIIGLFMTALLAFPALAATNAPGDASGAVHTEFHPGEMRDAIVVYTDDYMAYDYVIQALNNLGLAYMAYYGDYTGFETAVASGAYDLILVSHQNYFEVSYVWDDLLTQLNGGKKAILCTFDCDASDDLSGYMDDLLTYAGHQWNADLQTPATIYGWAHIPNPWWAGMSASIPGADNYIDDGDCLFGDAAYAFAGNTPAYTNGNVMMSAHENFIMGCWAPDEYPAADAILWWMNCITWILEPPVPTEEGTWGAIKELYR